MYSFISSSQLLLISTLVLSQKILVKMDSKNAIVAQTSTCTSTGQLVSPTVVLPRDQVPTSYFQAPGYSLK